MVYPVSNLVFQVAAQGTLPLSYQWFRSGVPLVDGTNVSGATAQPVLGSDFHRGSRTLPMQRQQLRQCCHERRGRGVRASNPGPVHGRFRELPCLLFERRAGPRRAAGRRAARRPGHVVGLEQSEYMRLYQPERHHAPLGPADDRRFLQRRDQRGDNDRTYLNLSYQFNGGALYSGNILLESYFCDLYPTNYASYSDQISLCNYGSDMPPDTEQGSNKPGNLIQRLAIGGWEGGDLTKYQCAVMTAADGLGGNNGELGGLCKYLQHHCGAH